MRKSYRYLAACLTAIFFSAAAFAQPVTISGTVRNAENKGSVPAVSVTVKGSSQGTFTDENGDFRITIDKLPVVLLFSSIGYDNQEITVSSDTDPVQVEMITNSALGQEVVVSATRTPTRILESPVSIERMSTAMIRNAAVPNYYDATANLKGVDLTTSGLFFRTISTRGFNGSGNLRFNQLVDGMDNQAPGLNFAVGSIIGPTELDVDNVELLQGASSALYGSGGMNGTLLITSKSPYKYQGISFQVKQGVMHIDGRQRAASPYYDWAGRWGKTFGEKFAMKLGLQFISAKDWQAEDYRNLQRNNVFSDLKEGDRRSDPNYDGVNVFGDEASASMSSIAQAAIFNPATNPTLPGVIASLTASLGRAPTPAEIVGFYAGNPAFGPLYLFGRGLTQGYFGGQFVSRTGYEEKHLVDYDTYNLRLNGGLYYKITNSIEASWVSYLGMGTTVYTGADRYALRNLKMAQHKLEFKGRNWFLRGYTTQENSGDSYTATTAAVAVNSAWKANATWFATYSATYAGQRNAGASDESAHLAARTAADAGRFIPGTAAFNTAFQNAIKKPIREGGAKFDDATDLYHGEGQLNLTEYVKVAEVLVGASYRKYVLNSNGTIFADTAGTIPISEMGGYIQLQRWFMNERFKLTLSGRYDKHENFDGRFTPRATALIKVAPENSIRLSYQQAYRFPSTQDQWINLQTPASRLIGMAQHFKTFFEFDTKPGKTAESIVAYRATVAMGTPNPGVLVNAEFPDLEPETVNSFEVGYRGLPTRRLLIDAYVYLSRYENFIARVAVGRGVSASSNPTVEFTELASPFTTQNYSFVVNSPTEVKAIGWGLGAEYQLYRKFVLTGNVSGDQLQDLPEDFVAFFNTPKLRFNIGLSNPSVYRNVGFNIIYRWQDAMKWEGTFGTGNVDAFGTLDAQVTYALPNIKSQIKLGASNLTNSYYTSAFGNPQVGGLYYVAFGYNIF